MKILLSKWILIFFTFLIGFGLFLLPLGSAAIYSLKGLGGKGYSFINYTWLIHQDGFFSNILVSLRLAFLASILNLVLLVPTLVFLNIRALKLKPLVEFICILPLIIPVVSLALGAELSMPEWIQNSEYELVFFYVIMSLPYTYRALDNSLQSVPLRTLVEASRSLGATWVSTILKVIVPSIRAGIYGSVFLCFALSLGEYTITSLLHWDTFPTWTVEASQENILGAIAISVFSFVAVIGLLVALSLVTNKKRNASKIYETNG